MKKNKIYIITLYNFETMNLIKILFDYLDLKLINLKKLEDYLKLVFVNNFVEINNNFKNSINHIIGDQISIISSNFAIMKNSKIFNYSISFFFECNDIPKFSKINELLLSECNIAASHIKSSLIKNNSLSNLNNLITIISITMISLLNSGITNPLNFEIPSNEIHFYSTCLSSHLQTQMTTIIETDSLEKSKNLIQFLTNFLLPFQLSLSSLLLYDFPIKGLFLQVVKTQDQLPLDSLKQFDRPWTWIRFSQKTVFTSNNFTHQISIFKEYKEKILMNPDLPQEEINNLNIKFNKMYRQDIIKHNPSKWSTDFLSELNSSSQEFKFFYCEKLLRENLEKSLLLIELIDHKLNEEHISFLISQQVQEIYNKLGIHNDDEIKVIVSFAQFFERRTFKRLLGSRKELFNEMYSAV